MEVSPPENDRVWGLDGQPLSQREEERRKKSARCGPVPCYRVPTRDETTYPVRQPPSFSPRQPQLLPYDPLPLSLLPLPPLPLPSPLFLLPHLLLPLPLLLPLDLRRPFPRNPQPLLPCPLLLPLPLFLLRLFRPSPLDSVRLWGGRSSSGCGELLAVLGDPTGLLVLQPAEGGGRVV